MVLNLVAVGMIDASTCTAPDDEVPSNHVNVNLLMTIASTILVTKSLCSRRALICFVLCSSSTAVVSEVAHASCGELSRFVFRFVNSIDHLKNHFLLPFCFHRQAQDFRVAIPHDDDRPQGK